MLSRTSRFLVPALTVTLVATVSVGVTVAASSSTGEAKACVRSNGALVVPAANGSCPKHTSKVTLGKRGKTGRRGPAGPSHAYFDSTSTSASLGSGHDVASVTVPSGSYVFSASVQFSNYSTSSTDGDCLIKDASTTSPTYLTPIPAGIQVLSVLPGLATLSVTSAGTVPAGTVTLYCADIGGASTTDAYGSLSAQQVGALTSTGSGALS